MRDADARRRPHPKPVRFEPLEPRLLLSADAPVVTDIFADARGRVEITVDQDLDTTSVTRDSVRVFTAGADGLLGTADDRLVSRSVAYDAQARQIVASATVDPDENYRVQLLSSVIRGTNGCLLDGEFNGPGVPTGDGVEGGDLQFFTRSFQANPIVRISTNLGDIDVEMFSRRTPLHVENFFGYMNRGDYDNVIFHRSVEGFVVQGGGFSNEGGFPRIFQDRPVQNEPGISNLRGTIALAKLGGDPSSGTNQFFFNLGNNSENLDNQNGGFTVFAEIIDSRGLEVMDAIASLMTVDASITQGAFTDMPVLSAEDFEDNGGVLATTNTVVMGRVAEVYEITGEAFRQLPTQGLITYASQGRETIVSIYSLDGVAYGNARAFLEPVFSGDRLQSLRIFDNPPVPIGIQIRSERPVDTIRDTRRDPNDHVRFVVSDTEIRSVSLRGGMTGENLNGVVLSGNVILPEDIDGDGDTTDPTSLLVRDGGIRSLRLQELRGSAVASGSVGTMTVSGLVRDADMVFGQTSPTTQSQFRFEHVKNSSLDTATPVLSLTARQWDAGRPSVDSITVPRLDRLSITGGRGFVGDFTGDLNIVGPVDADRLALGTANVRGLVLNAEWFVNGSMGPVRLGEGAKGWDLDGRGDVSSIRAGALDGASVQLAGALNRLVTGEWIGGLLSAGTMVDLRVTGAGKTSGDLEADINLRRPNEALSARSVRVAGDVRRADLNFASPVRSLRLGGDLDRVNITATELPALRFQRVSDTTLEFTERVRSINAREWLGGSIDGPDLRSFVIGGGTEGQLAFRGDFRAAGLVSFIVGGDAEMNAEFFSLPRFSVSGDVIRSNVSFTQTTFFVRGVEALDVGGFSTDSEFFVNGNAGILRFGGLDSTAVNLGGGRGLFGFPETGAGFSEGLVTEFVSVVPRDRFGEGMVNSYILGGTISTVQVINPVTSNGGREFGIAGIQLGEVTVRDGAETLRAVRPSDPIPALGDFQVRPDFRPPPDES
jgi:cyclophilin family peptidyl-prolyl cis-trans isomerase